jgi:hypothetical protein
MTVGRRSRDDWIGPRRRADESFAAQGCADPCDTFGGPGSLQLGPFSLAAGPFSSPAGACYTPVHCDGRLRTLADARQRPPTSSRDGAIVADESDPTRRPAHTLPGQPAFLRRWFGRLFVTTFVVLVILPVEVACVVVALHIWGTSDTTDKMAIAASLEVLLGMVVGLVAIFWGLLLTWFGVESAFTLEASGEIGTTKGKGTLQASAPGLVLFVGGMVLVGFCLYKPLQFSQSAPELKRVPIADKPSSEYDQFPSRSDLPKLPVGKPEPNPDSRGTK